ELGSRNPGWPYPSAQWVRECERMAELELRLPAVLRGEKGPAHAGEAVGFAQVCSAKHFHAAAARLCSQALKTWPTLADTSSNGGRYNAAGAGAQAGGGRGEAVAGLEAEGLAHWRGQALDWLRADLVAWGKLLDAEPTKTRTAVAGQMDHWLADPDF